MPLYDDIFREYQAGSQLDKAGSIMGPAKTGERQRIQSQGPLMSAIMDVAGKALDPIQGMVSGPAGTASQAMIRPEVWSRMQPEAKAMLNQVANKFPEFFQKILKSPTDLMAFVRNLAPETLGTLQTFRPPSSKLANLMKIPEDFPLSATMTVRPSEAANLQTPVHEAQHMLNFPRVQATDPADAATIGTLLNEIMPRPKGSLTERLKELQGVSYSPLEGQLSNLAQQPSTIFNRSDLTRPIAGGRGYYKTGETNQDMLSRMVMDEALSYLGEQARGIVGGHGIKPGLPPTPMVSQMAQRLGVGPEMPSDIAEALQQLGGWPESQARSMVTHNPLGMSNTDLYNSLSGIWDRPLSGGGQ